MNKKTSTRENELSQIAFNTNRKTLIAACDYLELATPDDKSPAGLHAGYSRIRLTVTDFAGEKPTFLTFFLKPEEIRRLLGDVRWHRQMELLERKVPYKQEWAKKKPKEGKVVAEALSISYEPSMGVPWKISIADGFYASEDAKSPTYTRKAAKFLTAIEFEDFLCKIVTYLDNWEIVIGAPYMKALHTKLAARFKSERDGEVVSIPNAGSANQRRPA